VDVTYVMHRGSIGPLLLSRHLPVECIAPVKVSLLRERTSALEEFVAKSARAIAEWRDSAFRSLRLLQLPQALRNLKTV